MHSKNKITCKKDLNSLKIHEIKETQQTSVTQIRPIMKASVK